MLAALRKQTSGQRGGSLALGIAKVAGVVSRGGCPLPNSWFYTPCCKVQQMTKCIWGRKKCLFFQRREELLACDFHNSGIETKEHSDRRGMRSLPKRAELWFQKMSWRWASRVGAALDRLFTACFGMSSQLHLALRSNSVEPGWEINRKV